MYVSGEFCKGIGKHGIQSLEQPAGGHLRRTASTTGAIDARHGTISKVAKLSPPCLDRAVSEELDVFVARAALTPLGQLLHDTVQV